MACVPQDCCKKRFSVLISWFCFFIWVRVFNHKQNRSLGLRNICFTLLIGKTETGKNNFIWNTQACYSVSTKHNSCKMLRRWVSMRLGFKMSLEKWKQHLHLLCKCRECQNQIVDIILNLNATCQLWATCFNQILSSLEGEKSLFSLPSFYESIRISIRVINNPRNRWLFILWLDVVLPDKILSESLFSFAFLEAISLLWFGPLVNVLRQAFGSQMEYNLNLGFPLAFVFECATIS